MFNLDDGVCRGIVQGVMGKQWVWVWGGAGIWDWGCRCSWTYSNSKVSV